MTNNVTTKISLIVPTRARLTLLNRFFNSLTAMTANPGSVEVILVVDKDDTQSLGFQHVGIPFKLVAVPPGLTMGELNNAGYAASQGEFVMLLNDDVVARTNSWDEKILEVFRTFPDEVVLVHVNDMIFQEKLCTFPFVTRTYCKIAGNICPDDYARYRIDDHIYNVFNLLAVLGKKRIVYLPEIVFEHTNTGEGEGTARYVPIPEIHASDTKHFDDLLNGRKMLAVKLAETIDQHISTQRCEIRRNILAPILDSVALRKSEYVTVRHENEVLTSQNARVTIGIVSADIRNPHAQICLDTIKKYTTNYDLIILDNNFGPNFNHSQEMNKILSICKTKYLVLMDDDVYVSPGWLDGMLRCMNQQVGVVTPMHMNSEGKMSYAGIVMSPDNSGHHSHIMSVPKKPIHIQTLCSAIMLIDIEKCGHIRVDESYSKYFLDIDYGLRIWESGFEVVLSPYTMVTHVGGGTMQQGSSISNELFDTQRKHFINTWIDTQRYKTLESNVWLSFPDISRWTTFPDAIESALRTCFDDLNPNGFHHQISYLLQEAGSVPTIKHWVTSYLSTFISTRQHAINSFVSADFHWLTGYVGNIVLLDINFNGHSIVFWFGQYYAIPIEEGSFDPDRFLRNAYSRQFVASSLDTLKQRILKGLVQPIVNEKTNQIQLEYNKPNLVKKFIDVMISERARLGAWRPAIKIVLKKVIRWVVIKLFGHETFQEWKNKWRRINTLPVKNFSLVHTSTGHQKVSNADSRRWLESSPQVELAQVYRGYKSYRYEFKYFGIPETSSNFCYSDFLDGKYGDNVVIAHSMPEMKASIDRLQHANERKSLLISPFPIASIGLVGKCTCALVASDSKGELGPEKIIQVNGGNLFEWARGVSQDELTKLKKKLLEQGISRAMLPWHFPDSWQDNTLEVLASKLVDVVDIIQPDNSIRTYEGENLHRLLYNKAYLSSMFSVVPQPGGRIVLEVGCSDGLVCDIFSQLGAKHVTGIDVMDTVGCGFRNPAITYRAMDAAKMEFPDQSFDITYSIATFEHVPNPYAVLSEMLRVTKIGGYCYVQAAPLYHSPFGHHMFAYFQDYPWIHLRKSPTQILAYMKQHGIDKKIEQEFEIISESYLAEMLTHDHINGLFLPDYGLSAFTARSDIQVLIMNTSFEGRELLTDEIISEIQGIHPDRLVEHGFEIAFKRIS